MRNNVYVYDREVSRDQSIQTILKRFNFHAVTFTSTGHLSNLFNQNNLKITAINRIT